MSPLSAILTKKSSNKKTGPIPVSTTSADTCPSVCPLNTGGCYAKNGPLGIHWRRLNNNASLSWDKFIDDIKALPAGQLWRHNQAGDLPGEDNIIDIDLLEDLIYANSGKKGFTYTHKPPTDLNAAAIKDSNMRGFTINLSGNNLTHADELYDLDIGPVVTLLDQNQKTNVKTPKGRTVVVCPATTHEDVTCMSCRLCADPNRKTIIGFPAHGSSKKKVSALAKA